MRRNSELASRLVRALHRQGFKLDGRRLERWCSDGLGAAPGLSFELQLGHYSRLAALSTSGRDADVTARRLATYGYACGRFRAAVARGWGADVPGSLQNVPTIDLSTSPEADVNFSFVEQLASAIVSDVAGMPPLMVKGIEALRRNAASYSDRLGESPDQIFHSFVVNMLCRMFGGDYYNGRVLAAVMNIDPDEMGSDELEQLNQIDFVPRDIPGLLWSAPLDDLVAAAVLGRVHGPELLAHLGIDEVEHSQLEDLAGVVAPLTAWLCVTLRSHFPDFPAVLPSTAGAALPEAS